MSAGRLIISVYLPYIKMSIVLSDLMLYVSSVGLFYKLLSLCVNIYIYISSYIFSNKSKHKHMIQPSDVFYID